MSESVMGEAPTAVTPRLIFDSTAMEDVVPQFLRGKTVEPREPGDPEKNIKIVDPVAPVAVVNPVEEVPAPVETTEPVEAPAEIDEPVEVEAKDEDHVTEATPNSFDDLSVEELRRQQEEIDRKIREKQEAEKKAVIEQIVNVVETYKIPLEELVDALGGLKIKRKGVKAIQKYQDPKTGATWSGRGKEPAWIKGKNRAPFLID